MTSENGLEVSKLRLVPAYLGCNGCYYVDYERCPGDEANEQGLKKEFWPCNTKEQSFIFVEDKNE